MNPEGRFDRQEVGVCAGQAVFCDIQAFDLLFRAGPQADGRTDQAKDQDHAEHRIGSYREDPEALDPQLPEAAAVEQAFGAVALIACEQSDRQGAPDPVDTVHRDCTDRIVHVEPYIQRFDRQVYQDPRTDADQEGTERVYTGTARRNRNQSRQRSVQTHRDIRLAVFLPGEQHACYRRDSRSDGRRAKDPCHLSDIGRGRSVEAVPGEPQDKTAQCAERHRMSRYRV